MGISYNPSIVTEGLVLALDPQSPRFYNYKGRSVAFDGTGDYLRPASSSDFAFGTSDFTIELWINILTTANDGILQLSTTSGGFSTSYTNGLALAVYQGELYYAFGGAITNTGTTINDGTWRHIAMCRSGSSLKIFVNGVSIVSETNTGNVTATNLVIGGYYSTSYTLDGKISNLRILKGTALYTANFTPPTEPLTAVTNTKLLTCQGNTISDASSSGHTITPTGNAAISYSGPFSGSGWTDLTNRGNNGTLTNGPVFIPGGPFNNSAGAVQFDGTGDYLSITDSTDFDFGSGDFTIEFFLYSASFSDYTGILGKRNAETDYAPLLIDTDNSAQKKMRFLTSTTGSSWISITSSSAFPLSQWVHVAVVRSGSTITLYENGVSKGSASISGSIISNSVPVFVGAGVLTISGSARLNGFLSNLRIIKGTALYTSNFTPPTGPLEAIDDTVLLTCQGGAITDNGPNSHAITVNNDAKAVTASAFEFDGSNDYISINQFDHTATNTVEMWFKKTADVLYACPYAWGFLPSQRWQFSSGDENMNIYYNTNNGGTQVSEDSGINVTTLEGWVHIVVTADYNNNEYKTYKNGSLVQTGDLNNQNWSYVGSQSYNFIDICRNVNNNNGFMSGNVSVLRIYRKVLTASEVQRNFSALRGRYGI